MSIEAMKQTLDLSTPKIREMVTRHAAAIDPRATLEDMPEALAFQIGMARALLKEFTAIQQAEAKTDESVGAREALERIASWSEHPAMLGVDYGSNGVRDYYRKIARDALTHPAPGVPDGYVQVQVPMTVTNDDEAGAYMDARLWEFADMAAMFPKAKPDPRTWGHVMIYAPQSAQQQQQQQPMTDEVFDLICNAIDKADTITMEGDYMLDSDDCIAVVRVMQALLSVRAAMLTAAQAQKGQP